MFHGAEVLDDDANSFWVCVVVECREEPGRRSTHKQLPRLLLDLLADSRGGISFNWAVALPRAER